MSGERDRIRGRWILTAVRQMKKIDVAKPTPFPRACNPDAALIGPLV
jgi:hypothetical protein